MPKYRMETNAENRMDEDVVVKQDKNPYCGGHWLEESYLAYKDDLLATLMFFLGGDRATAEDVLHDVFVSLARRRQIVVERSARNYLITACLNRARDVLRSRNGRAPLNDPEAHDRHPEADPSRRLELEEEAGRLFVALTNLPAAQREIVAMHIHGRMRFREIAGILGISINTVQSRYRYALASLRKSLADGNE